MKNIWRTARREFDLSKKPLVMGILNVTPDSFSDGGRFLGVEAALQQADKMIAEGADILDVGGESTRPNSRRVSVEEETRRVLPVIAEIDRRFRVPVSIDTSKSGVAIRAVEQGAEIINDVSGLRFDPRLGEVAAREKTGLVLMHLRGEFETMHRQPPVTDILKEVADGFRQSVRRAVAAGNEPERICLDPGIGFSKTFEQNLELIAKLDKLCKMFPEFPMLVGLSRKSFIGKILEGAPVDQRLTGTLAASAVSVWNGAAIVRVHDVRETVEMIKVVRELKKIYETG